MANKNNSLEKPNYLQNHLNLKCKAKTQKGRQCKLNAMINSNYCFVHSIRHIKNVPLWRNLGLISIIVTVLVGFGPFFYTIHTTPTLESQEQIVGKVNKIEDLVKAIKQIENYEYDNLRMEYPFGYVLFSVDHKNIVTPHKSKFPPSVIIDWESTEIKVSKEEVIFVIPDMKIGGMMFRKCILPCKRKIGERSYMSFGNIDLQGKILDDDGENIICIFGFAPQKNN